MVDENTYVLYVISLWIDCFNHISPTLTFRLTTLLAAWSWAWFLEVSTGSVLLASDRDSLEALIAPWSFCCLSVFITDWSWHVSAEGRIWSGFSSNRRLGGLLNNFLLCTEDRCCSSGWICSGSGLLSSGGGSSTETRLATREDGSTAVTTRVTLRGKGAWRHTKIHYKMYIHICAGQKYLSILYVIWVENKDFGYHIPLVWHKNCLLLVFKGCIILKWPKISLC